MKTDNKNSFSDDMTPALSFGLPLVFVPLMIVAWIYGGWTILAVPIFGYVIITIFDFFIGTKLIAPKINPDNDNKKYKVILFAWPPIQIFLIFGSLIAIFSLDHLSYIEALGLMLVQGLITGAVGIVFAHELMHQKTRFERFLSDLLMGMAIYGHFRTEHVLVHHRHVGTENDAVTAKFEEGFYKFFIRIIPQCFLSAWNTESERLSKQERPIWDFANPFYVYLGIAILFLIISFMIGGTLGIICFLIQAFIAVLHLEVVNYIEHYGLIRQKLENGKYEPTRAYHSWNANHHASNLLLINLQKHSDHHAKPNKTYQFLQSYDESDAPQLPFGYPLMVFISLVPMLWMKVMNPKVREWRKKFYPEIQNWEQVSV